MAVAAFRRWDRAGRPLEPAKPVEDIVARLKAAYPRAASVHLFSWYANSAHYEAELAEDHTPYSQTGWPDESPEWWVFATDIMHRPDLGVDCRVLFKYWLAEARGGRFPSLKYMNWQGKQYRAKGYAGETRPFKKPWPNSGHYDHIHLSFRTDFKDVGLGGWSVTPDGAGTPASEENEDMAVDPQAFHDLVWINAGMASGLVEIPIPQMPGGTPARVVVNETAKKLDRLLEVLTSNDGASADLAPVIAAVRAEGTQTRGAVGDLKDAIAQKEVELTKLRLDLSEALKPPTD